MRELKFRWWDIKNQIMFDITNINFKDWITNQSKLNSQQCIFRWPNKEVVLMQYTGLKDKNWKELYEGDIYELKTWSKVYYRWYIRILDTYSGFRHKTIKTERVHRYKYWPGWNKFEIIWNIYENPELLN